MPPAAELLNPSLRRRPFRAALFDFDGTLSLFREGWPAVMVGMMAERLRAAGLAGEPDAELRPHILDFVMALNGRPSIAQMERFAEEVRTRGGHPEPATAYLDDYLARLMAVVRGRWAEVTTGTAAAADWVVPNAHAVLANLGARGVALYVASGTDLAHVRHEADLLGLAPFFGPNLYAPADNTPHFSKRGVIERILAEQGIDGSELVGFGDGVTETQEVKRVGGVAVAVASVPKGERGVHADKRERLAAAGADVVVADYAEQEALVPWLFGEG